MRHPYPHYSTACPDWQSRIVKKQSLIPCGALFPEQADLALRVFKELVLPDVAGVPKIGMVTRQWIYDFVAAVFGAYNPNTGERLIQEFFLLISKKNAKSTISAGIMLTALILNWRAEAEFFIIAPTVEVANNSFKPAKAMIRADARLSALFQVRDHTREIVHRETGAVLKVIAAESDTVSGIKGTGVLIEEVWLFGKRPKAADMFIEAKGGLAARPEGFVIYLSTHSDEAPAGVFADLLKRARAVRDGKVENKRFLPVLYEFPPAMLADGRHKLPENFYITNPNLGASVSEAFLLGEFATARHDGETALRRFMAKHLNVEIGLSLSADYWAGAEFWEAAAIANCSLDDIVAESEVITIGIDGGGLDDLLGLAVVGRSRSNPRQWLAWHHAWAHPSVLQRRKEIAPKLHDFARAGDLTLVNHIGEDTDDVAAICADIFESGLLDKIGLDPHGVGAILDAMLARGLPEDAIIGISQGWKLGSAIKTAERKLAEGCLKHGGSAMMNWVVGNARVEARANGILITKQASGTAKIDPLIALFNAVSLMALNPQSRRSVYEQRGLRFL
ncbi:terminase large subunit [Conchiformibius kuhniae]|uniref:Terminase large subunit n=1 Tax=Conchiformibius kuhniae TaxID=211502 RepID=A0A8T9MUL2_9NEIS|nr:terminase large subunit [Conchiformibius kuhniae]UOP05327.1 terminase large subunit [Conchiformibius kuhniae]